MLLVENRKLPPDSSRILMNLYSSNDNGKITFDEIEEVYRWIVANFPNCKGFLPVNDFVYECKRRYDANENGFLTYEEGRELCFILAWDSQHGVRTYPC